MMWQNVWLRWPPVLLVLTLWPGGHWDVCFGVKPWYRDMWLEAQFMIKYSGLGFIATVDGSEIRLTSGYGKYPHYLEGFIYIPGGWPWDFWTINTYHFMWYFCLDVFQPWNLDVVFFSKRKGNLRLRRSPWGFYGFSTPRKFNIAPKNRKSQKETHLPSIIFQGLC